MNIHLHKSLKRPVWLLAWLLTIPFSVFAQQPGVVVGNANADPNATLDVRGDAIVEDTDPLAPGFQVLGRDATGLIGTVDILSGTGLAANDILVWDGTQWVAGQQQNLSAGTAIDITGGVISGAYQAGDLINIATDIISVVPPTTGTGEYLRWDGTNWTLGDPVQAYTGDAYITVDNLAGTIEFNATAAVPNAGDVLIWNGTAWEPQASATTSVDVGASIAGDGTAANPLIIAQNGAVANDLLVWDGAAWVPQAPAAALTGGPGIDITGNVVSGDYSTGTPNYLTIDNTTGTIDFNVDATAPVDGDVLVWDNANGRWATQASAATTVNTDAPLTGDGSVANPVAIAAGAAATPVLTWDGTNWVNGNYNGLNGITVTGLDIALPQGGVAGGLTVEDSVLTWNPTLGEWTPSPVRGATITEEQIIIGTGTVGDSVRLADAVNIDDFIRWDGTDWVIDTFIGWKTEGNLATDPAVNYLGTGDAQDLVFRTDALERMRVLATGNVGIGTTTPDYLVHQEGETGNRVTINALAQTATYYANLREITVPSATDSVVGTRTSLTVNSPGAEVNGLNIRTAVSGTPTTSRVSGISVEARTNSPANNNEAGVGVEAYGTYIGSNTTVTASIEDMPAVAGIGGRAQVPDLSRAVVAVGGGGTAFDPQQGFNAGIVGSAADGNQGNLGIGGAANGSINQYYSVIDAMPAGSGVGVGGYNPLNGPNEWGLYIDGRTRHTLETNNLTSTFNANMVNLSVQNATDSVVGTRTDVNVQDAQGIVNGLNIRTGVSGAPTQERVSGISVEARTNSPANNNEAGVGVEAYGTYIGSNTTVTASIEDMPAVAGIGGRAQVPDLSRAVVAVGGGGTAFDPQQGFNAGIVGSAADGNQGNLGIGGAANGSINQYYSVIDAMPAGAGVAVGGYNPLSSPNEWGSYIIGRNYHSVESNNVSLPFRASTDELTIQNATDTVIGADHSVEVENGGPFVIGQRVLSRTDGVPSQSAVFGVDATAVSNIAATSGAQEFAAGVRAQGIYTGPNTSTAPITTVPGVLGSYNEALVANPARAAVAMGSFGTAFRNHLGSNSGLVGSASGAASSNIGLGGVANGSFGAYIAFGSALPAGFGAAVLAFNPNPAANNYGVYAQAARHRLIGELQMEGDIAPTADATFDLGSTTNRFQDAFVANGVTTTSDRRMKTNIAPMRYGLKEILALEPVQYNWKAEPTGELKLGLIAQDVQNVVNEVVQVGDDAEQRLGLNYAELVPVLINGMKEQQAIIDAQQAQIDELKTEAEQATATQNDMQTLKAELEELKSTVETLKNLNGVQAEQR